MTATAELNGYTAADVAPPHSLDAEKSVLGSILLDPDCLPNVEGILEPRDFYGRAHRAVFEAMLEMRRAGASIDPVLLRGDLEARAAIDDSDPDALTLLMADLVESVPVATRAVEYAEAVRKLAERRRIRSALVDALEAASDPRSDLEDVRTAIAQAAEAGGRSQSFDIPIITAAELATARFEITYDIPGLMVRGQPLIIVAPKKSMKTSAAMDAAISLSIGGYFLGRFRVPERRRVLVMSGESGMHTLQETCFRICDAAGVRLEDTGLLLSEWLPSFGNPVHSRALRDRLTREQVDVVFFDPLYLCLETDGREGSIFAMGPKLRDITRLCIDLGITPVILHHMKSNRADPHAPGDLDDSAWAGTAEFARQWWLITRREPYQPGTGQHRLTLSVGGSAGHSSLWGVDIDEGPANSDCPRTWRVEVRTAEDVRGEVSARQEAERESKKTEALERYKAVMLSAVKRLPGNRGSLSEIRGAAGVNHANAQAAAAALVEDGSLVVCQIPKTNGRSYQGFCLGDGND